MTRPTWSEARDAIACRQCKADVGEQCRSLLDRPLRACHGPRMDDAAAALDYLELS